MALSVCSLFAVVVVKCECVVVCRARYAQLHQAYSVKYCNNESVSFSHQSSIHDLVSAVVRLELLSSICSQRVKVDVSSVRSGSSSRGAVDTALFIMYNCARLATLFQHFTEAVSKGKYRDLPDLSHVDWSLLKLEEEWQLLLNYVVQFDHVVNDCVHNVIDSHCQPSSSSSLVTTHKVGVFLRQLSSCLSSYYSKTHVLCEPREHLLGTMHARLYLLKAVEAVMHRALRLLGIEPISHM